MGSCFEERIDIASYALGVLPDHECAHVEEHLADCDDCALELATFLPTVAVLDSVDPDLVLGDWRPHTAPALPSPVAHHGGGRSASRPPARPGAGRVWSEERGSAATERRGKTRRLRPQARASAASASQLRSRRFALLLAAAVAVILSGVALSVWPAGGTNPGTAQAGGSPTAGSSVGPDGRYLWAVNPVTGTRLDIMITDRQRGTHMSFSLTEKVGPLRCRLITVARNGSVEVVSSWAVPAEGYGTTNHPGRLQLQANSSLSVSAIDHLEVEVLNPQEQPKALLSLPVR
jgi:hypothetical protein